ncbi:hypothetical protein TCAL_13439 [Tigriopus californicus]|uniref:Sorting nexin/Vps5-like C-terminal domain-containing protein n=1 Tax=Tigriopus californicus TaxID=6832 RepID=A0A553NUX7_TIGCA|nr:hypothetical protein TCAL_13439 [Tigriopus californicus]|eukprot:TCALIF_13439-PA protein Name:"Similar to Snx32 Sorting nexin-32 (Mus musculus)" AED:0.19 eAED:0.19 QI:0/0/0.5/1/1/1/2/224/356
MDGSLDHVATTAVDLTDGDAFLTVDISDALSERDWVKFTVHSKTSMSEFTKGEFSVIRLHEEFRNLTKEEFNKMKQELEAEYLATFKKTVAMHETFLCRLAAHPVFRFDRNLHIFLEFDKELNVRGKNKKEKLAEIWSSFHKSGDELLLGNTLKDVDEFFENERNFILDYQNQLRDSTIKSDKMILLQKYLADNYIKISQGMTELSSLNDADLAGFLVKVAEALEKMRRIDGRVASDQDLKLADTLRYHMRDTNAAKDLLYRRLRCLANYENANKNLEKARTRNREVNVAENLQTEACQRFENISAKAKDELKLLRTRRVAAFQKSLTELAELELKHSKAHAQMLRTTISALKADL